MKHATKYKMAHLAATCTLLLLSLKQTRGNASTSILKAYDPLSPQETCYAPLSTADTDQDGKLSREEYVQLINELNGEAQEFGDLAFELQTNFVYLNCVCGSGESGDCCDGTCVCEGKVVLSCLISFKSISCCTWLCAGYIDVAGAGSNDATEEQLAHLDLLCFSTQYVVDSVSATGGSSDAVSTESPVVRVRLLLNVPDHVFILVWEDLIGCALPSHSH